MNTQRFAEWPRMVQALLEERFKLAVHRETKEVPGFRPQRPLR
jgi:uncharacterized protein (TIGR03435 family)